jgi:carboxypeptidase family protein/TonB-dependent receptor-like protein
MPSRRVIAALVVIAAAWGPAASASQLAGVGTGSVVGIVKDAAGLRVPAVGVTISGLALMTPRKMTTQADGEYRFVSLPPGDYVLTFVSPGFESLERQAHVSLGFTLTVDVTLTVAPQREEIVVYGALDRQSAAISQSFDAIQLASLPSSRSMGGLFALTHALALSVAEVGGGTGIISGGYGAYGRNNSPRHTIEGIVVTGLFGAGFTPDYGSLEEVSVLTAAHGAEWPTAGIHTDFATKSGSNQYRGTIYGAAEHRRLQSSNVDADQIRRGALAGGGLRPGQVNQVWHDGDVNADVGGYIRRDRVWWYSSVRFQDVAARLVNFPVEPSVTRLTNYSGKATFRVSPRHTLVFYGQRALNHQPNRLDPFAPAGSDLSAVTAINETSDSTVDQRNAARLWKGEWDTNIRDSMVFELRAGQFGWDQDWTPRSTAPRFEDLETLVVAGGNRDWENVARRNQLTGTAGYFTQNRTGRHDLRFGGEALRFVAQEMWFSGYPGNVLHVLRGGRPLSVFLFETPSSSKAGVWTWSAYASDAWQPTNRLTLTLGVRYDRYRLFLPAQEHPAGSPNATKFAAVASVADWTALTPRLAAVFDVKGDGKTLAKFSFGRYRVAPNATLGFNSNPNSNQWWSQYDWTTDLNKNGVWDPGEEGRPLRRRGGNAVESMDPELKLPVLDEAGGWIERSLAGGVALRTGAIWRLERFPFVRQNINQPFEAFTVPVSIRDRGPDGLAGTGDDGPVWTAYDLSPDYFGQPLVNEVRNVAGSSSEYFTLEIEATRRMRGQWTLGSGFAHTWNGDHASGYSGQSLRNNAYPLTPNDLLNAGRGGRYEFSTWTAKVHGTFEAPWQLHITPVLRHQSGQPFGRTQTTNLGELSYGTVTLLMESIGTRRLDNITLVDVRIEKSMQVKHRRVAVFLDVFNCLNANPELNAIWSSGASFLRPLTIVSPRIARVGLTVNW